MSTLRTNNVQVGQSATATNNFTLYQPSVPDGTVRLGVGNTGATTLDAVTVTSAGNVGIGTSSPTELLTINGSGKAITRFLNGGSFAGVVGIDNASYVSGTNGDLTILSGAGKSVVLAVNAGTRAAVVDSAANFQFNSGYGSVAVAYGCRAWVNFNGTGTVAIRASGNVSSITDGGVGIYTVNFTTAMPDGNFSTNITANDIDWGNKVAIVAYGTTSVQLYTLTGSGSTGNRADASTVCVAIFR
jgi:hypothetical protein